MEKDSVDLQAFFSFWNDLAPAHRDDLLHHTQARTFEKGRIIMPFQDECLGLILVQTGQLRAFVLSDTGKEITLYRLYPLDVCLFSASCIMKNIQFDIQIEVEMGTDALLIPSQMFGRVMEQSTAMANYTNALMAARFSDVMWTLEQVLFKSMDTRLAQVLLQYATDTGGAELSLTHEVIARDLGSAREVVTRLLKYFRGEGLLALTRGRITLLDMKRLRAIADG